LFHVVLLFVGSACHDQCDVRRRQCREKIRAAQTFKLARRIERYQYYISLRLFWRVILRNAENFFAARLIAPGPAWACDFPNLSCAAKDKNFPQATFVRRRPGRDPKIFLRLLPFPGGQFIFRRVTIEQKIARAKFIN